VAWPRSRDLLLNFGTPQYIPGTAKARNLKFSVRIDFDECYSKHAKLGDRRGVAQVTWPTFKFWDPQYLRIG